MGTTAAVVTATAIAAVFLTGCAIPEAPRASGAPAASSPVASSEVPSPAASSPAASAVCKEAPARFVEAVNAGADGSGVKLSAEGAALYPAEESASGALQYLVGQLEGPGVGGTAVAFVVGVDEASPGPIMAAGRVSAEFFDWPLVDGDVTPTGAVAAMRACGD